MFEQYILPTQDRCIIKISMWTETERESDRQTDTHRPENPRANVTRALFRLRTRRVVLQYKNNIIFTEKK